MGQPADFILMLKVPSECFVPVVTAKQFIRPCTADEDLHILLGLPGNHPSQKTCTIPDGLIQRGNILPPMPEHQFWRNQYLVMGTTVSLGHFSRKVRIIVFGSVRRFKYSRKGMQGLPGFLIPM